MDGSLVLHSHDEKEEETSPEDILVRRLKNRERQRRYRARKRHEADQRMALAIDPSARPIHYLQTPSEFVSVPVEVEISLNPTSPDRLNRVHCQRDWKKDARRAHLHKKQEVGSIGLDNTGIEGPAGRLTPLTEFGGKADLQSDNFSTALMDIDATNRLQPSRRHWKAEARNKRSLE